jgi:hypothetical protein
MNEPHPAGRLYQERDSISFKKASIVIAASLALVGILSAIAWGITRASLAQHRPFGRFPERHIDPRGHVPETRWALIDRDAPGLTRKRHEQDALQSYGWVDPKNRIVRIPIDQAMDLIASGGFPENREKGQPK